MSNVTKPNVPKSAITVPEFAARVSISVTHAWELVRRRAIPSFKIGKSRRIPTEAVDRFIEARLVDFAAE